MSFLFGYYGLGLRAMNAARLGLQVTGDNISNAGTPGYARRRLELGTGHPTRVQGGLLDTGVNVERISRLNDRLVQASLERELGTLGYSDERLRGLRDVESIFGPVDGDGILAGYAEFSEAFNELAAQPENLALRRGAVGAADVLARRFRETSARLLAQRRRENDGVAATVEQVNELAVRLAQLNREISENEADGTVAAPLRDQREQVVEQLVELTGGTAASADGNLVLFSLPAGATLVSGRVALPLGTTVDVQGMVRVLAGGDGRDLTDRLRSGKLGGQLSLRDDVIPARLADLDAAAQDLIDRANALTTAATDLNGNPGVPLFTPLPSGLGPAGSIAVTASLLGDPRLLAVSASGAPGDGSVAIDLAGLRETASAALGNRDPAGFLGQLVSDVGTDIVQQDVAGAVSRDVVATLEASREAVSGVSLDEEAVALIQYQRSYEAGARFLQVLNEITEITVNLI